MQCWIKRHPRSYTHDIIYGCSIKQQGNQSISGTRLLPLGPHEQQGQTRTLFFPTQPLLGHCEVFATQRALRRELSPLGWFGSQTSG